MTKIYEFIIRAMIICFLVTALFSRAHGRELTVYVGPQSVTVEEMIYVSVETAAPKTDVALSYIADGERKMLIGTTRHGLVSFDVPAQKQTGLMRFAAKTETARFYETLVTVLAGPPQPFTITTTKSLQSGFVDISSDVIVDKYRNAISELSAVSIEWIDAGGLRARQTAQLAQGRIALTTPCPLEFTAPIKIRGAVHSVQFTSADLSSLCALKAE